MTSLTTVTAKPFPHMIQDNSGAFNYHNRELKCGSVSLSEVAREFGTPAYVYSLAELRGRAQAYLAASARLGGQCLTCYAVKANGNPALLRVLSGLGLGADIVSGGELFLAEAAGFPPHKIVFSGVGKTRKEIEEALVTGVLALHIESLDELGLIAQIAQNLGHVAPVAVRVNPDIRVDTHAHVSTGEKTHKFGVTANLAEAMIQSAAESPWLRPVGISAHIGSQITSLEPFKEAAEKLGQLADALAISGVRLDYIDMGGGLAIDYGEGSGPGVFDWLAAVSEPVNRRGYKLLVEPGRSITGPAGVLLTRVLHIKEQGGRRIVVVDAGMNDLLRPALYDAQHPIVPVAQSDAAEAKTTITVDLVGPVCESSDVLARDRTLPELKPGEYLAILKTGAYGFSMSSNYNGRQRPAEVLVEDDTYRIIREREQYDTLLYGCSIE